jgi:hypothetical protein
MPPISRPARRINSRTNAAAAAVIECLEGRELLSTVNFTLDPERSSLTLSGTAGGAALAEQSAGSLEAIYSGTIVADVLGESIEFLGGSTVSAETTGDWLPGGIAADYGGAAGAAAKLAIRDLGLDVTSPALPLSGGGFSSTQETIQFTGGAVAYDPGNGGTLGNATLAGQAFTDAATLGSSIVPALDGTLTLTLRVTGAITLNDASLGGPVELAFNGRLVGVGPLPLPSPDITVTVGGTGVQSGGTVDFGTVAPGAAAVTRTITVRNDGNRNLVFSEAATAPAGYTITQALPQIVSAGTSADLIVALDTSTPGAPAGALTIPSNDTDETPFTLNLTAAVQQPSGVTVSDVTVSGAPARIIGGDRTAKASVAVTLTDVGDQDFNGPVTVTLFASTDNTAHPNTDTKLAEVTKKLKIKANAAAKPLKLKVQFPAVNADGDYVLVAQATGTGVSGGQSSAVAQGAALRIERPFVDLAGTGAAPTPLALTSGKKSSLSVPLMNNGNVAAKGSVNVELFLSIDGTEALATPLATVPAKVSISPGASKPLKVKLTVPAGTTPGSSFVLVRVTGTGPLAELNASNGLLLTPIPATLAG